MHAALLSMDCVADCQRMLAPVGPAVLRVRNAPIQAECAGEAKYRLAMCAIARDYFRIAGAGEWNSGVRRPPKS
jgi:hypothetical protein